LLSAWLGRFNLIRRNLTTISNWGVLRNSRFMIRFFFNLFLAKTRLALLLLWFFIIMKIMTQVNLKIYSVLSMLNTLIQFNYFPLMTCFLTFLYPNRENLRLFIKIILFLTLTLNWYRFSFNKSWTLFNGFFFYLRQLRWMLSNFLFFLTEWIFNDLRGRVIFVFILVIREILHYLRRTLIILFYRFIWNSFTFSRRLRNHFILIIVFTWWTFILNLFFFI